MGCITSESRQKGQLTFHFAGIKRPKWYRDTLNLPDAALIITINSSLTITANISTLKQLIRKTYKIQSDKDILILYSHTIISHDDALTLEDFNITNNSLLFIAINADIQHDLSCCLSPSETKFDYIERENSPEATPPYALPARLLRRAHIQASPPPFMGPTHIRRHHLHIRDLFTSDDEEDDNKDNEDANSISDDADMQEMHDALRQFSMLRPIRLDLNAAPARRNHQYIHPQSPPSSPPAPPSAHRVHFNFTPITQQSVAPQTSLYMRRSPIDTLIDPRLLNDSAGRTPRPYASPSPPLPRYRCTLNESIANDIIDDIKTRTESDESFHSLPSVSSTNAVIGAPTLYHNNDNISVQSVSTFSSSDLEVSEDEKKAMKGFDIIMQEDDVLVYKMPNCGHVMNKESLYQYALNVFSDHNNMWLKCPHAREDAKGMKVEAGYWSCDRCTFINKDNRSDCEMCRSAKQEKKLYCEEKWEYSKIKNILAPEITEKGAINIENIGVLTLKLAKLELFAARNVLEKECNVQKCPQCDTLYFRENDDDKYLGRKLNKDKLKKLFETKCVMCSNYAFCFGCGAKWEDGHFCDSSFRSELIKILKESNTKQIGEVQKVPSIRCCPNCCQLINHSDACKHMKCKACKTDFCFICLKQKKDGNWQCGSHSDPCSVAERQNAKTLPASVVINKKAFKLAF